MPDAEEATIPLGLFRPIQEPAAFDSTTAFPLEGRDVLSMSDAELMEAVKTAPALHILGQTRVARVTRALVIKAGPDVLESEAQVMRLVFERTTVKVPRVYRYFSIDGLLGRFGIIGFIVMDYVEGRALSDCWSSLTFEKKRDMIQQAATSISALQSIETSQPGPISGGPSQGYWFTDYSAGPFEDVDDFLSYFNEKLKFLHRFNQDFTESDLFHPSRFVICHLDFVPRNMVLEADGALWILDWGWSGSYPPFFEAASVARRKETCEFSEMLLGKLEFDGVECGKLLSLQRMAHHVNQSQFEKIDAWIQSRKQPVRECYATNKSSQERDAL